MNCKRIWVALSLLSLGAGCGDNVNAPVSQSCELQRSMPLDPARSIDVLLVVDDSPGIADSDLVEAATEWAQLLENIEGGLPDIQIGVVSASGDGELITPASQLSCAPEIDGDYLIDQLLPWWECQGTTACREPNYTGSLSAALECMMDLGSESSAPLQPLDRIVAALQSPGNTGFRRDEAFLAVIVVSSTDDQSTDSVASYAEEIRVLIDPALLVLGVVGPANAPRFAELSGEFPARTTLVDIESESWTDALIQLSDLFARLTGGRCLEVDAIDVSPEAIGLQVDCAVESTQTSGRSRFERCSMESDGIVARDSARPCYWLEEGAAECSTGLGVRFELPPGNGGGDVEFRCQCAEGTVPEPLSP